MGRRRDDRFRDVDGIVLLDKPVGLTSNQALQQVKRLFAARKAGHTGSLDPLASGLLVLCFGEATKVSAYLLDAGKRYEVSATLGTQTDTGDAAGKIVRDDAPVPSREQVEAVLDQFRGEISQVPPMYSALKHEGRRLYELAREGIEIERQPRRLTIKRLEMTDFDAPRFDLDVACSKGTYVRTLVEDIAAAAGSCAYVERLRRVRVGPLDATGMVSMATLEAAAAEGPESLDRLLQPIDSAIAGWPAVELGEDASWYLRRGQPVTVPRAPAAGRVRLYGPGTGFIGIGEVTADGRIAPKRLFRLGNSCL